MGAESLACAIRCDRRCLGPGVVAIVAWRRKSDWFLGAAGMLTVMELCGLFFLGPVSWRWPIPLPEASPLLCRLAGWPTFGLVGGRLLNLPVNAGQTVAYPNLGITPPPPNYLLEPATYPPGQNSNAERMAASLRRHSWCLGSTRRRPRNRAHRRG